MYFRKIYLLVILLLNQQIWSEDLKDELTEKENNLHYLAALPFRNDEDIIENIKEQARLASASLQSRINFSIDIIQAWITQQDPQFTGNKKSVLHIKSEIYEKYRDSKSIKNKDRSHFSNFHIDQIITAPSPSEKDQQYIKFIRSQLSLYDQLKSFIDVMPSFLISDELLNSPVTIGCQVDQSRIPSKMYTSIMSGRGTIPSVLAPDTPIIDKKDMHILKYFGHICEEANKEYKIQEQYTNYHQIYIKHQNILLSQSLKIEKENPMQLKNQEENDRFLQEENKFTENNGTRESHLFYLSEALKTSKACKQICDLFMQLAPSS